ncbi:hypothetical protein [Elizabethkingia sp. JS20170427COW]|uniref:DUF7935 family protein n=1 Tax=Elizabethkingia sp. JS20170427COW TaxID=2583851 RepID=UPI001110AD2C|nr:hypothetical protein [Elizabethkingia sp. JS20170427COW]QCX52338.1 hypothetical protein FGE20_00520 [Elizabethkingia sp. JS20170427COW]
MSINQFLPYAFALFVVIGVLVFFKRYADVFIELKKRELALLEEKNKPVKNKSAYQRLSLFLERIKPSYLVTKFDKDLAPHEFVFLVEKAIQQEFEYNIDQQEFIPTQLWGQIVEVKDEVLFVLRKSLEEIDTSEDLQVLKTKFLLSTMENDKLTVVYPNLQNELNNNIRN